MTNQHLIPFISQMIIATPKWVWFIFGYLSFVGIKAMKSNTVYLPNLFILPIILTGIKYKTFLNGTIDVWSSYLICFLVSTLMSFKFTKNYRFEILKNTFQVKLPGTYSTLIILMSFFSIKYIFGYLYATHQELYQKLIVFEISVSGIFSGYFFGKAIKYLNRYIKK